MINSTLLLFNMNDYLQPQRIQSEGIEDQSKLTARQSPIKYVNQSMRNTEKSGISKEQTKYETSIIEQDAKFQLFGIKQTHLPQVQVQVQVQNKQHIYHNSPQQKKERDHQKKYKTKKLGNSTYKETRQKSQLIPNRIQQSQNPTNPNLKNYFTYKMADRLVLPFIHIHDFIINVFDRSQTQLSKLAHVIIPFGLLLLEVFSLTKSKQTYIHMRFMQMLKLLNNPSLQKQINSTLFRNIYLFFAQYQLKTQEQVAQMLYRFLNSQRDRMQAICPYYLNMFILIVNKNKVFIDSDANNHLEYTIQMEHPRYQGNFTVEDVKAEVERLNSALTNAYNSTQI